MACLSPVGKPFFSFNQRDGKDDNLVGFPESLLIDIPHCQIVH